MLIETIIFVNVLKNLRSKFLCSVTENYYRKVGKVESLKQLWYSEILNQVHLVPCKCKYSCDIVYSSLFFLHTCMAYCTTSQVYPQSIVNLFTLNFLGNALVQSLGLPGSDAQSNELSRGTTYPKEIIKIVLIEDFFHLPPVSTTTVANLELRISQRIFEKIPNGPNGIIRGLGKLEAK
jgi:hypothetical protein